MQGPEPKPLSEAQKTFLDQRIKFLEHQLRLLKLGKPGVNQVMAEIRAELTTHRTTLGLEEVREPKKPTLVSVDGKPLGRSG